MRIAKVKYNDVANCPGIGLSIFVQGCTFHCPGCFNQETWDFEGGYELTEEVMQDIINRLQENGIKRNVNILGGEPLHPNNTKTTAYLIKNILQAYPQTKIYVWTGFIYEDLLKRTNDENLEYILRTADVLIDGPYIEAERDVTLHMRGSRNQRIIELK